MGREGPSLLRSTPRRVRASRVLHTSRCYSRRACGQIGWLLHCVVAPCRSNMIYLVAHGFPHRFHTSGSMFQNISAFNQLADGNWHSLHSRKAVAHTLLNSGSKFLRCSDLIHVFQRTAPEMIIEPEGFAGPVRPTTRTRVCRDPYP